MLRSLSGTGLGGKLSAPDDGPGPSADDDVLALGRDLAARASAILRREGASPSALIAVGETMSAAGARWRGPGRGEAALGRRAGDYPLWCEADGTFELILRLLPVRERRAQGLGYDTCAAYAPVKGAAQLLWIEEGRVADRSLAPGDGFGLPAGCLSLTRTPPCDERTEGPALLCLFGISRLPLPPPVRVALSATRQHEQPQ